MKSSSSPAAAAHRPDCPSILLGLDCYRLCRWISSGSKSVNYGLCMTISSSKLTEPRHYARHPSDRASSPIHPFSVPRPSSVNGLREGLCTSTERDHCLPYL